MSEQTIEIGSGSERAEHQIRLTVVSGPHRGRSWVFDQPTELVIGREPPSNLVLSDELALSRQHTRLILSPPSAKVVDLQSRNGLFVNGVRLVEATLASGDTFGVGDTTIQFELLLVVNDETPSLPIGNSAESTNVSQNAGKTPVRQKTDTANPPTIERTRARMGKPVPSDDMRGTEAIGHAPQENGIAPTHAVSSKALTDQESLSFNSANRSVHAEGPKFSVGQHVAAYRLESLIGSGGMASVYRATHRRSGELFAVKLIRNDLTQTEKRVKLFVREGTVITQLRHPRIVHAFELGIHELSPYLVMEYIDAIDLMKLIDKNRGKQRLKISIWVISRVLEALHYLHNAGLIHRDIKPGNILGYKEGHRLQVKLADFGLAKIFADSGLSGLTNEKSVRGTLAYMSPEHFRSSVDARPGDDLFSCGATLYRFLTGQLPNMIFHPDDTLAVLDQTRVPEPVKTLVKKAIALDPNERFQDVRQFADAIKSIGSLDRSA